MAILQSRMIALINAAIDYQTGLRELQKLIHETNNQIQSQPLSIEEVKNLMLNLILKSNDLNILEDAGRSQATITGEHYRYSVNKKRNEWNRQYQEKKRGGITTKHHIEPDYATEDFSTTAARKIPFRSPSQNQRGFTSTQKGSIIYTPGELSAERRAQLDKEIARSFAEDIPKGEDFQIFNEEVDPNFPKNKEPKDD